MKRGQFLMWISTAKKIVSFQQKAGFDTFIADSREDFWEKVYSFLDMGYRIQ